MTRYTCPATAPYTDAISIPGADAAQHMFCPIDTNTRQLSSCYEPSTGQRIVSGLNPAACNRLRKGYVSTAERRRWWGRYTLLPLRTLHTTRWSFQRTCASADASSGWVAAAAAPPQSCASHDPIEADDDETCDARYQAATRKADAGDVIGALGDLAALSRRYPKRQDVLLTAANLQASAGNLLAARQLAAEASAVVSTAESQQVSHCSLSVASA